MSTTTTPHTPEAPAVPGIYQAIWAVMRGVTAVTKDGWNNHSKYNFRGVDDVVNAVGPQLREHGVMIIPEIIDTKVDERVTNAQKLNLFWTVRVRYTWYCLADGSSISCEVLGEAADTGDKGASKAQSVAYRVAILQVLCIPTSERDPDADTHQVTVSQETADSMTKKAEELYDKCNTPVKVSEFRGWANANRDLILASPVIVTRDGKQGGLGAYVRHLLDNAQAAVAPTE